MDEKAKNSCPNCCQQYSLKTLASDLDSNIPVFIKCGHSMCESCIRKIIKLGKPVECKICLRTMDIKTADVAKLLQNKLQLYKLFPVNLSALGELTLQLITEKSERGKDKEVNYFIDLQAILDSTDQTQGQCLECHKETTKMCQQCATILCEDCFSKSHKSFVVFKNHVLQNIELQMATNNCKTHSHKALDYYCKVCAKSICMDCLIGSEKSCKNHDVVSSYEMNEKFLTDLREILPQVDITFRRLTKTAVDIGNLLKNMEYDSGSTELQQVTAAINQHFSKLYAMVQAHEQEVLNNVARLRQIEKESLLRTREDVASAIRDSKKVLTALKSALDSEQNRPANLSALLEEAKNIVNKPWSLVKDESNKDTLKVCVSEELCLLVSDYVQLVGNAQARYALRPSHELPSVPPPPSAPVFPPTPTLANGTEIKKVVIEKQMSCPEDKPFIELKEGTEIKKAVIETPMACPEEKPFIELKEGVQELATVTHMRDPHDFYVRRAGDEPLLTLMESQLRESLGDVPRDVAVGKTYAVNHESSWKRGRVEGIEDDAELPAYRVTCVDYGYTTIVAADQLRDIPAALTLGKRSRYPSPLALRCRLANCAPSAGAWRPDDTELVRRVLDKSPVLLNVRRAGAVNECDVTARGGVSVAHVLCFHARASLVDPLLPYPERPGEAPVRLQPANTRLRVMRVGDVLVTHVDSPGKFYVRESCVQADYVKLCEDLNRAYDARDESGHIYLPKMGMVCAVLVGAEQGWARGVVTAAGRERCGVWLPDCGRWRSVPWHRLRAIDPRLTALKALAVQSYLAGVVPRGGRWPAEASELLARRLGRGLRAVVRDDTRRGLGLVLLDLTGDEPLCLNQEMVDGGFADPTGFVDFQLLIAEHAPKKETKPQPLVMSENPSIDTFNEPLSNSPKNEIKLQSLVMSENASIDTSNEPTSSSAQQESHAGRKGSIRLEAKILVCDSPSLIYIALVHQQKTFNELFEDIQKFYMKRITPRRENWKRNDRCCALCIQSETWRRATILKMETDKATVFYTDFAQTETVPISHLKKLHSDFEVIGDAAIKCHMADIVPAAEEWPSLTNEFLKDKMEEYRRVFVTKVGPFVETSMPVELWVYHTEQGSALEPDESEWRCLNAELAARGLAVPVPRDTRQNDNDNSGSGDEELSFLNVRGPVRAWLLPPPPSPGSSGSGGRGEPGGARWLPPEPLRHAEFTAVPTYIDNDGIIYLHDVTQQDDLDFIRDTLQMAFKEPDPKAPFCSWRVGEPCVARYYLDSHFYRGIIVEVNAEQSMCSVQYVDYGNIETCTFEDLRKRIALHQIPVQAHKCALSRVKPTADRWHVDVLDYIHKAIVEKKCLVKVAGPALDGVTPVDLKYDKLWFNDHLVEFDLAAYIDGSKPLRRQFVPTKGKNATGTLKNKAEAVQNTLINIDSSSEPDYVVEEDMDSSQASGSPDSFKMRTLVDRDGAAGGTDKRATVDLLTYPRYEQREFQCTIPAINDTNTLELSIIRDPEFNSTYEELLEAVKEEGAKMPPLDGIYEYKPCIALFEDEWYRASILKYSEAKNLIKVLYVDYGNIGIVPLSDVKEISKDWVLFPPICVTVRLHGVTVNPELHPDDVTKAFIETFLEKGTFSAKIVDYENSVPLVELRNSEGELVSDKLIEDSVFLRDSCDNCTSN